MQAAGQCIVTVIFLEGKNAKNIIVVGMSDNGFLVKMPQMARSFAFFYSKKP